MPATARNQLIKELLELRNERGVTLPRVNQQPTLVSYGGTWRRARGTTAETDVIAAAELLETSIRDLHPRERDLLLAQFAFTFKQASREQREKDYLNKVRRDGDPGSMASFERWSKGGIAQVADRIIDRATHRIVGTPPADSDLPAVNEPFTLDVSHDRYRFRPGRVIRDMYSERVVTSLAPGDHMYLAHHVYYSDPGEGVLEIEPEFGCEMASGFVENGLYFCVLALTKTLAVGETFRFSYRTHIHSDEPCTPVIRHIADFDSSQWILDIEFARDEVPDALWMFTHLTSTEAQVRRFRRQAPRPHDGSRYLRESWQGLKQGRAYGLDWDWEPGS
jgi:hypothetical protein